MVQVVPLFSTQHEKGNTGSYSNSNMNNTQKYHLIFEGLMEEWLMSNKLSC